MKYLLLLSCATVLFVGYALAQQAGPTDAVYWCNISRAQVSAERDSSLAQIEALKARIKELEAERAEKK